MKRLLILCLFLVGGLFQAPASAESFHESECKEAWQRIGGGDAILAYDLDKEGWDVKCWDYVTEDGKRWIGSNKSFSSSASSSSSGSDVVWCVKTGVERHVAQRSACLNWGGTVVSAVGKSSSTSSAPSSSSNSMVWCASHTGVFRMRNRICTDSEGHGYTKKAAAEAQYHRLRADSSSYALSSSSGKVLFIWCATAENYTSTTKAKCLARSGKVFTTYTAARQEHRRLKSTSSTSSAWLTIRSNVTGDRVYIDGKYEGSTRLNRDLPKGRHTVRIEKKGYKTYEEEIDLKNALTLHASLVKSSSFTSYASSSSFNSMVWCASHTGVFRMRNRICTDSEGRGYTKKAAAEAQYRRLKSGSSSSISYASLTIRSNVRGDSVYIDGKYKGSTRLDLSLPKGRHTIRIEKEGYKTYEEKIDLSNALTLRASLEKVAERPVQTASTDDTSVEVTFWKSIQGSSNADVYKEYLRQFPDGVYAGLARIKIKELSGTSVAKASIPNLDYGRYHALVIGNNNYEHLPDLETAVSDARRVASVLEYDYGFDVKLLKNATRSEIIKSLSGLRRKVGSEDNLLIYYAGHGNLDKKANEGYWLPIDAEREDPSNWIANDMVVSQVRAMDAKHVMVVADSCFSGTITRGLKIEQRTPGWLLKIVKKKSRTALTSGGLEPVMDSGGGNHSAFASAFISLLEENDGVLDASQLFSQLRPKVMVNSDQTPEYGNIHQAGHDGGDFLFVRQ